MQSIYIISDHGNVSIIIDGAKLERLHSFSIDYVKGARRCFSPAWPTLARSAATQRRLCTKV